MTCHPSERIRTLILLLLITPLVYATKPPGIPLPRAAEVLDDRYQTLSQQFGDVMRHGPETFSYARAFLALRAYAETDNEEITEGMQHLLQPAHYNERIRTRMRTKTIVIDGDGRDWIAIPAHTPKTPRFMERARYALDEDDTLFALATLARGLASNDAVQVCIDCVGDGYFDFGIWGVVAENGTFYHGGTDFGNTNARISEGYDIAYGSDIEVRVSLQDLVKGRGPLKEEIRVRLDAWNTKRDTLSSDDPLVYIDRAPNYAFRLLLRLLAEACYTEGDTMTLALALANNYIYAKGTEETRAAIEKDIIAHYRLYQEIRAWQEEEKTAYALAEAPLVPKIFWADRVRTVEYDNEGRLPIARYREFVDSIETYKSVRTMARTHALYTRGYTETAARIEEFETAHHFYRTSLAYYENKTRSGEFDDACLRGITQEVAKGAFQETCFGTTRELYDFQWINNQVRRYKTRGRFEGDCGTMTTVMIALYKMAGIPAASFQWYENPDIGSARKMHNFPLYYHNRLRAWVAKQTPGTNEYPLYLHYTKPKWHHAIYHNDYETTDTHIASAYYPGDRAETFRITHFLRVGFPEDRFERVFFSGDTLTKGLFFTEETAPFTFPDEDEDGLIDKDEARMGTSPRERDSDGDGALDRQEVDYGTDPRSESSHPFALPTLSGFVKAACVMKTNNEGVYYEFFTNADEVHRFRNRYHFTPSDVFDRAHYRFFTFEKTRDENGSFTFTFRLPKETRLSVSFYNTHDNTIKNGYTAVSHDGHFARIRMLPPRGSSQAFLYLTRGTNTYTMGVIRVTAFNDTPHATWRDATSITPFPEHFAPAFFTHNLSFTPSFVGNIRMRKARDVTFALAAPPHVDEIRGLLRDGEENEQYGQVAVAPNAKGYDVTLLPTKRGTYTLDLFVVTNGKWEWVTRMKVDAEEDARLSFPTPGVTSKGAFPLCTKAFHEAGLSFQTKHAGYIAFEKESATVTLRVPDDVTLWHGVYREQGEAWNEVKDVSSAERKRSRYSITIAPKHRGRYRVDISFKDAGKWQFGARFYVAYQVE